MTNRVQRFRMKKFYVHCSQRLGSALKNSSNGIPGPPIIIDFASKKGDTK